MTEWIKYNGTGYPGFSIGTKLMVRYRDGGEELKNIRHDNENLNSVVWGWDLIVPGPDEIIAYKFV